MVNAKKMKELEDLSHAELLSLYETLVRVDHYDPGETAPEVKKWLAAGVNHQEVRTLVINRMGVKDNIDSF